MPGKVPGTGDSGDLVKANDIVSPSNMHMHVFVSTQHLPSAPMCRLGPKNSVGSYKAQIILVAAGSQWPTDDCPKAPRQDKVAGPDIDLPVWTDLIGIN